MTINGIIARCNHHLSTKFSIAKITIKESLFRVEKIYYSKIRTTTGLVFKNNS